jgi:hypothetical protein
MSSLRLLSGNAACLSLLLSLLACTEASAPVSDGRLRVSSAKVVSTTDMSVSSATPDSATQDTTLSVVINGSGFVAGTSASWALGGVPDAQQIRTNSTRFVNSHQIVANITVSPTATVGKWDIVVTASGKKGGIGTEAFTIKTRGKPVDPIAPTLYISNDPSYTLRGDAVSSYIESGSSAFAGMSRYADGECGVSAKLFAGPGGSGDLVMGSDMTVNRKCRDYPRGVRVTYALINGDGSLTLQASTVVSTFFNLAQIEQTDPDGHVLYYIPIGTTASRGMNIQDDNGRCITLRHRTVLRDGTFVGGDEMQVTRTAPDTWIAQTQPDETDAVTGSTIHHDKAWCEATGQIYHLPMMFIIKTAAPVFP